MQHDEFLLAPLGQHTAHLWQQSLIAQSRRFGVALLYESPLVGLFPEEVDERMVAPLV